LKYDIKEINLLFFKCVQMFHHKSKEKGKKGDSSSSPQARSGTSADLFAIMVLLNFYLHVIIHYYFIGSSDIFYRCICLHGTSTSQHRHEAFLEVLNDKGQQQMAGAWPELEATLQEAPEEPEDRVTQQEAPEGPDVKDDTDDQPQVIYKLVQF
jgi:hypothetical protein